MSEKFNQLLDKTRAIEGMLSFLAQAPDNLPVRESLIEILNRAVGELHLSVQQLSSENPAPPYVAVEIQEEQEADEAESFEEHHEDEASAEEPQENQLSSEDDEKMAVESEIAEPTDVAVPTQEETEIAETAQFEETEDADVDVPVVKKTVGDARGLLKLSIGDRYRFRRELFNFSDDEMDEALSIASEMSSKTEVEDYFYNDLCFEPENPDVVDFMRIVCARFN